MLLLLLILRTTVWPGAKSAILDCLVLSVSATTFIFYVTNLIFWNCSKLSSVSIGEPYGFLQSSFSRRDAFFFAQLTVSKHHWESLCLYLLNCNVVTAYYSCYYYYYPFLRPLPFYGHYTGQPALGGMPSYELVDFVVEQSFTAHMLLLMQLVHLD